MMTLHASLTRHLAGFGIALVVAGAAYAQDPAKASTQDIPSVSISAAGHRLCDNADLEDVQLRLAPGSTGSAASAATQTVDNLGVDGSVCRPATQAQAQAQPEDTAFTVLEPASEGAFAKTRQIAEAFAEAEHRASPLTFSAGPPPRNLTRGRTSRP